MKPWRLSQQAEQRLSEIAEWTTRQFGLAQAVAYRDALIDRISGLASGRPPHGRPCEVLMRGRRNAGGLKYYREGSHYLVYRETRSELIVLEVFHASMNLEGHIGALTAGERAQDDDVEIGR